MSASRIAVVAVAGLFVVTGDWIVLAGESARTSATQSSKSRHDPKPARKKYESHFASPPAEDVATKWTLATQDNSQSCEIDLVRAGDIAAGSLISGFDCPDGMFNVVGWRLDGLELRFLSPTGRVMMRFMQTSAGWTGERENDGAILRLVRAQTRDTPDLFMPPQL